MVIYCMLITTFLTKICHSKKKAKHDISYNYITQKETNIERLRQSHPLLLRTVLYIAAAISLLITVQPSFEEPEIV